MVMPNSLGFTLLISFKHMYVMVPVKLLETKSQEELEASPSPGMPLPKAVFPCWGPVNMSLCLSQMNHGSCVLPTTRKL